VKREREDVLSRPLLCRDFSVLAAQIARLARLWLARIASRDLATLVRVQVGASASAVAIHGHRLLVQVVQEGATGSGQAGEGDAELDAGAVGGRDGGDGAADGAALLDGQRRDVAGAGGAVRDLGGGGDGRGLRAGDGGRGEEGDD
jgi:hypothetical protein